MMGKNFLNKLGNILRVFKGVRKKDGDDLIDITTDSNTRTFDSSSQHECSSINKKLFLGKSKSIESITTATVDSSTVRINELKRSNGTCDILSTTQEEHVNCTRSLHRLGNPTSTNQCIFSYNAKLHDSTIWSRALRRVAAPPRSRKTDTTSASTIPIDSEISQEYSIATTFIHKTADAVIDHHDWKVDKSTEAKAEIPKVLETKAENISSPIGQFEETKSDLKYLSHGVNHIDDQIVQAILPRKEELPPYTTTVMRVEDDTREIEDIRLNPLKEKPESSSVIVDENKITLKMDVKTIQNDQGFSLLKYDVKSSGDHAIDFSSATDVVIDQTSLEGEPTSNPINASGVLSENATEYEVVNLTQVDLFSEFKTTISKMRNVLNVLDVKKSIQCIIDHRAEEQKIKRHIKDLLDAEDISTQTAAMPCNQISTSTECGLCNQTKNEGIMVQLSSGTTSNRVTTGRNLLKHMRPKTKRRKKRGFRCKTSRISKRALNTFSSSQDGKLRAKSDRPRYHKCVVYHITQHKNAVDRCVGTPCTTAKEDFILKDTFSALHFGPINQFPILLDKRENEKKRELEQKLKTLPIDKSQYEKNSHRRKSTSFLSSDTSNNSKPNTCLRSRTQPSLNCASSIDNSSNNSASKSNLIVFNTSPSLAVKDIPSTSEDFILDKNRKSTQDLVSNILQEEFKTSGIRGKISSSTMNMIKDQFCDKINGVKTKDVPDVMITLCVPLKNIVSKIKTSKKGVLDDKTVPASTSNENSSKLPASQLYDKSIQVNSSKNYVNDNLQTIPEKMSRKSTEIYQHNKMAREGVSSKRLSTFKKIFGNKATSCSNVSPFGDLAPITSKIYFSEHSTSSPDFDQKSNVKQDSLSATKKIVPTPKNSSLSIFRAEFSTSSYNRKQGFFLNLPSNRYKKKRDQISKLFDSDSSDLRFSTEPTLLYHVHESSFYSTSKTDDKLSCKQKGGSSSSQEKIKATYFPVQEAETKVDLKVNPKLISFSDLQRECSPHVQISENTPDKSINDKNYHEVLPKPSLKDVNINTSYDKFVRDNETQCDYELNALSDDQSKKPKLSRKRSKKLVEAENFINNCIDEFSMVKYPKVHFEDEMHAEFCEHSRENEENNENFEDFECNNQTNLLQLDDHIIEEPPPKAGSNLSLFQNIDTISTDLDNIRNERKGLRQKTKQMETEDIIDRKPRSRTHQNKKGARLQTSSDSNLIRMKQKKFEAKLMNTESTSVYEKRQEHRRSREMVRMEATQVDSVRSLPRTENSSVQEQVPVKPKSGSKLSGLMKEVVELCTKTFVKSRDCIVELTLYNLIKEIILEHSSHLSEQSRQKVESILANFIQVSKQKAGTENVDIVESAIESLVKEISSAEFETKDGSCEVDDSIAKSFEVNGRRSSEHKHIRKHSRSKSKRTHKHESKHRSRHRETEGEQSERHSNVDDEARHKSKHRHKHRCEGENKCEIARLESEEKFRSIDGKKEYLELVKRLKELENVTKELTHVAQNQNKVGDYNSSPNNKRHNSCVIDKPKLESKKKFNGADFYKGAVNVNYFQPNTKNPVATIPRNYPKLPVTKIVINLSNLKLLTKNCVSLSSTREPIIITDSTEQKKKLINKIVSYQIDNGFKSEVLRSSDELMEAKGIMENSSSEIVHKKQESFIITFHDKNKRKRQSGKDVGREASGKDVMRIKMVKKKKTVTSASDSTSDSPCSMKKKMDKPRDKHRISKEYVKREYQFNSEILCTSIAKEFLDNKYNIDQILNGKDNMDHAYQRMANFCLFRGLLKKESNCE